MTIQPQALLEHARRLAGSGRGRPPEVDLRRGISSAYYALFHDLTDRAAKHLIGSAPEAKRNEIRRAWSHGEVAKAADIVLERARVLANNANAKAPPEVTDAGPLVSLAADDADLLEALRLFSALQNLRHTADYDHNARIGKPELLSACADAQAALDSLTAASAVSLEAYFTLLTLRRKDLRDR